MIAVIGGRKVLKKREANASLFNYFTVGVTTATVAHVTAQESTTTAAQESTAGVSTTTSSALGLTQATNEIATIKINKFFIWVVCF